MKLEKILDHLNSFEKNAFLKIIDGIIADKPKHAKAIDEILMESSGELKNVDNANVAKVFALVEEEFAETLKAEFVNIGSQLDILIDIVSRDGNCIMKQDWFSRLYEKELAALKKRLGVFRASLESEKADISEQRRRDYRIYLNCLKTAYINDEANNQERKVTSDELSILLTLANQLGLSQEEVKLINYLIIPVKRLEIDTVINELKSIGAVFYSKKGSTLYVADEMVRILRKVRGKEVADKFFRRVLRLLREPQINLICKQHSMDWRLPIDEKIKNIIHEGISFSGVLMEDLHREGTKLTEKKQFVNELCDKGLKIDPPLKGVLIEQKVANLITYFEDIERDEKVGISVEGYENMLIEMGKLIPKLNAHLRRVFELQEEQVLKSGYLLDFNIKPRDVLEVLSETELQVFCQSKGIKTRGDQILNILDAYKDTENLYLENYEHIGFRNLAALRENGLIIKEAELGAKFEELTKKLFQSLGFNVDERLCRQLNTAKDKIDVLLNLDNEDLILVECKTVKESGYNKFSAVSRQLKAYAKLVELNGYKVRKSLLVAPDFSDDFVKECGLEYELNLSLIKASSLLKIAQAFRDSKLQQFPHNLLMRDVLIQEERVIKAVGR